MPSVAADYRPRTRVELRLNQQKYRQIASLTHLPLAKVIRYGDDILKRSMFQTILDMEKNINKYVPAATKQLRHSLTKQLNASTISNNWLQMKLGTYVSYMKYVANMSEKKLRHPKHIAQKSLIRKRNTSRGKKGSRIKNPGIFRYVRYYGAPRWVRLNDPQAQKNFFTLLITHMKTQLQKRIGQEIRQTFPAGQRKPWTDKFKVVKK